MSNKTTIHEVKSGERKWTVGVDNKFECVPVPSVPFLPWDTSRQKDPHLSDQNCAARQSLSGGACAGTGTARAIAVISLGVNVVVFIMQIVRRIWTCRAENLAHYLDLFRSLQTSHSDSHLVYRACFIGRETWHHHIVPFHRKPVIERKE